MFTLFVLVVFVATEVRSQTSPPEIDIPTTTPENGNAWTSRLQCAAEAIGSNLNSTVEQLESLLDTFNNETALRRFTPSLRMMVKATRDLVQVSVDVLGGRIEPRDQLKTILKNVSILMMSSNSLGVRLSGVLFWLNPSRNADLIQVIQQARETLTDVSSDVMEVGTQALDCLKQNNA